MTPVWYVATAEAGEVDAMLDDTEWLTMDAVASATPIEVRLTPPDLNDIERYRGVILASLREIADDPELTLEWRDETAPNTQFPQHSHRYLWAHVAGKDEPVALVKITVLGAVR